MAGGVNSHTPTVPQALQPDNAPGLFTNKVAVCNDNDNVILIVMGYGAALLGASGVRESDGQGAVRRVVTCLGALLGPA